jgi:hypothetical protein
MKRPFLIVAFMLLAGTAAAQSDSITVTEGADAFELTVPVSRLTMSLPKEGLRQKERETSGGSTASRRYYYLEDPAAHIILSGWFEAAQEYPGAAKVWAGDTAAWALDRIPTPFNVVFKKLGGWDTVIYQMPRKSGTNTNIRAHWVAAGTWIDLHLSTDSESSEAESRKRLEAFLAKIRVSQK